jgi:hypothetical protein
VPEKRVEDLSREEALNLIRGLRIVMYRQPGDWDGRGDMPVDVWDPDGHVDGAGLVEWVGAELERLGLVPVARPVREDE